MKIDKILTGIELDRLAFIAKDEHSISGLKKVLLSAVYFSGTLVEEGVPDPQHNFALALASRQGATNEEIGAELRASLAAVQLLETGFKELEKYKVQVVAPVETKNQAR